jgi:hypothetical protein
MTLFLLNLSLADFVLTVVDAPLAVVYFTTLNSTLLLNHEECYILAAFRHASTFVVWLSLGLIALSR